MRVGCGSCGVVRPNAHQQHVSRPHLDVRDGRFQHAAPVDQTFCTINQPSVTESDEGFSHGSAKTLKNTRKGLKVFVVAKNTVKSQDE